MRSGVVGAEPGTGERGRGRSRAVCSVDLRMEALHPTLSEAAEICDQSPDAVAIAVSHLGIATEGGRITGDSVIQVAEELGSSVPMGTIGAALTALATERARDEVSAQAAIAAIDDALLDWVTRQTPPPGSSFLEEARRILPDELLEPVARVWENPGRGQRRPSRPAPTA